MDDITNYGKIAYIKAEEIEEKLATINKRIYDLEVLYGATPEPEDPNDTDDTPYTPPSPGTIITTGALTTQNIYYTLTSTFTSLPMFFTSDQNSTLIIKTNILININENPLNTTIQLYVDDVEISSYSLTSPSVGAYTIPFATTYTASAVGHKIHFKITPSTLYSMSYKVVSAEFEILGNNVDFLTTPFPYTVHYDKGTYYIGKIADGNAYYLNAPIGAVNLGAEYTLYSESVIGEKFIHSMQKIDDVWQTTYLGVIKKVGTGVTYIINFEDDTKYFNATACHNADFLPNGSTGYGGSLIFAAATLGNLYYYDAVADFSSRATRTIETCTSPLVDGYVNAVGVQILDDSYNTVAKNAKIIATRIDGTNFFFDAVKDFHKLEIGYGTNITAHYANESGSVINVYMRIYNQLVKKVLTFNTSTSLYEITEETAIGTWDKYISGYSPAYFTITNNVLSFNDGE
ncbi:MAG: hypothetical protein AB7S44_03825 [Spirochaetales bacterium]